MARSFVDRNGSNYTLYDVEEILIRACGYKPGFAEHIKVGQIYQNGSLWFQRIS